MRHWVKFCLGAGRMGQSFGCGLTAHYTYVTGQSQLSWLVATSVCLPAVAGSVGTGILWGFPQIFAVGMGWVGGTVVQRVRHLACDQ